MRARLFWRSLFIQALWNPRDLQGAALEWALAAERSARPGSHSSDAPDSTDAPDSSDAPGSTAEPEGAGPRTGPDPEPAEFVHNGHPYLSGIAIGALVSERERGASASDRGRLRRALRGPLGSLGDALVWTGWVPAAVLLAVTAGLVGVSPLGAALLFLALHNVAHCTLRWWGVSAGLTHGRTVGLAMQRANLTRWAARFRSLGLFTAGLLIGVLIVFGWRTLGSPLPWLVAGSGALLAGAWRGMRLPGWTPAALALGLIGLGRIWGLG